MAGRGRKVLRIVSAAALVVLVGAGCGDAARSRAPAAQGVPRALAQEWAARASAIAAVAAAGNGCRAVQLADSLREDVVAAEGRVPQRLRSPLVTGVNALADRLTCVQKVTVPKPPKKPPKPHKPPKKPPDHRGPGDHEDKGGHK